METQYHRLVSTLAASTLIILFVEILKVFQKKKTFQRTKFLWKKNQEELFGMFQNIKFFDMECSKLIESSTDMCWSCPLYYSIEKKLKRDRERSTDHLPIFWVSHS
jgi:hypothetical protein